MNNASRELGGAFGVAVLGSVLSTRFTSSLRPALEGLPEASRTLADSGLPGALQVARALPGGAGDALADAARSAFVDGFATAGITSAALAVAVGVGAFVLLPREASASIADADVTRSDDDLDELQPVPTPAVAPSAAR
jgi:hypothetical protein